MATPAEAARREGELHAVTVLLDNAGMDVQRDTSSSTLEGTLQKMDFFIDQVFAKKTPLHGKQQLYLAIEEAVLEGQSRILLRRFLSRMQEKIFFIFRTSLCPQLWSEVQFLRCSANAWNAFRDALHPILQVLAYLERHVMSYTNQESLLEVSYSLWFVFQQQLLPSFNRCIVTALLAALEQHRNGDRTWENDLRVNLHMLLTLGTYREVFEEELLHASWEYYQREGRRLAGGGDAAGVERYCIHVQQRLEEEDMRVSLFFSEHTREPLLNIVRKALVGEHLSFLADASSLKVFLHEENHIQLHRLALLLGQVQRLDLLNQQFQKAAKDMGTELLQTLQRQQQQQALLRPQEATAAATRLHQQQQQVEEEEEEEATAGKKRRRVFIPQLLLLKEKHERAWRDAFNSDPIFSLSIKEAWEKFLNQDAEPMKLVTHALAKYCDSLLRRSSVGLSADEVEREMQKVMVIFRHLEGKDFFEEFYRSDLCKRLLMRRSANEDSERSMVQKLKEECGQQYTSRLENMFKDVQVSRQTMAAFKVDAAAQRQVAATGIEFDVSVCAAGMWPQHSPAEKLLYPPSMQQLQDLFAAFYRTKHAGRSLCWTPRLGTCDIRACFSVRRPAGLWPPASSESKDVSSSSSSSSSSSTVIPAPASSSSSSVIPPPASSSSREAATSRRRSTMYLLKVSEMQALILLLFNDRDMATTTEVEASTGITGEELQRQLVALYVNRATRILLRRRTQRAEEYFLNFDFQSKLKRVQVMQIQLATQPKEEMEKAEEHVAEDRSHHIDACIVRVMKTKKQLHHSGLVAEVLRQIPFTCEPTMVKKRIESLLSREYIRRDDVDRTLYRYLA